MAYVDPITTQIQAMRSKNSAPIPRIQTSSPAAAAKLKLASSSPATQKTAIAPGLPGGADPAMVKTGPTSGAPAANIATQKSISSSGGYSPSVQMSALNPNDPELQRMYGVYGGKDAYMRDAKAGFETAFQRDMAQYSELVARANDRSQFGKTPGEATDAANYKAQADALAGKIANNVNYQTFFGDQLKSMFGGNQQTSPTPSTDTTTGGPKQETTGMADMATGGTTSQSSQTAGGSPTASQPGLPQNSTPPQGATLISGPSGLQGLTESQIWRDPNSKNIYKLPDATGTTSAAGSSSSSTTTASGTTTPGTSGFAMTPDRQAIINALQVSPEEEAAQNDLTNLQAQEKAIQSSANFGITDIQQATIPMKLILGQSKALQDQAANQLKALGVSETTIKDQLALMQAKRKAALDVAKEEETFAKEDAAAAKETFNEQLATSKEALAEKKAADTEAHQAALEQEANARIAIQDARLEAALKKVGTGSTKGIPQDAKDAISMMGNLLVQKYRGSDGYVDTAKYKAAQADFDLQFPDQAGSFEKVFPPSVYLNPNDPTAQTTFGAKPTTTPG